MEIYHGSMAIYGLKFKIIIQIIKIDCNYFNCFQTGDDHEMNNEHETILDDDVAQGNPEREFCSSNMSVDVL